MKFVKVELVSKRAPFSDVLYDSGLTGWISEIRIYFGTHDSTQLAAVLAEMV